MAMQAFPGTIRFINQKKIPPRLYHSWCKKAVSYNPYWISAVPFSQHYYGLCLKAVKKDGKMLEHVKYLRLSPEQYATVCKAALAQTKEAEEFIRPCNC
jgi:hypothetical protein